MGGAGHMASMNTILRNNKNLLRKVSIFKKDRSFMSNRKAYLKATKGDVDIKKLSKQELRIIRERVIKEREKEQIRNWVLSILIITPILILGYNIFDNIIQYQNKKLNEKFIPDKELEQILLSREKLEKKDDYYFFIDNGDEWIEKRNWKNAIFQYKNAVQVFPEKYEANYRLALAYSYKCKFDNSDCDKGLILVERLMKVNPNDKDLMTLKSILENNTVANNVYNSLLNFVVLRQIKLNLNTDFFYDKSYDIIATKS